MIEFVREMDRNYLKIVSESGNADYCMKMLENNVIDGFLPTRSVNVNNQLSFLYDISGNMPLEEKYQEAELSAEDILRIAGFIREIIRTSENYMLNIDGIVFDTKYIFCGINDKTWSFVYNSDMAHDARDGIKRVMEFMLGRLNHKDGNAVILGYGLYKRVCRDEIPITQIFDKLEELTGDEEESVEYELNRKQFPTVMPESITEETEKPPASPKRYIITAGTISVGIAILAGVMVGFVAAMAVLFACVSVSAALWVIRMRGQFWERIVRREVNMPYEVDTPELVVNRDGMADTDNATVLMSAMESTFLRRISRDGPSDEYMVAKNSVSIGSGASADIVIKDEGVSRLHARLTREGEMYFIKDMNSTNGTWVNEHRLSVYELCPVRSGDIIRLAQSRFELIDTSE